MSNALSCFGHRTPDPGLPDLFPLVPPMIRLSYIVLPRLTAFESPERFKAVLACLRECGYQGGELNITEPFGIEPALLEGMIEQVGLAIPSFLTGEAYADGLCLSSP